MKKELLIPAVKLPELLEGEMVTFTKNFIKTDILIKNYT